MNERATLRILVVYASDQGHTRRMAEAIAEGASGLDGSSVALREAARVRHTELAACDALVAGTPVHMAGMDWRLKKFIDHCNPVWMADQLQGKAVGAFATGGGYGNAGGGCDQALLGLLSAFAAMGMVPIPLPKSTPGYARGGTPWGPWGRSETSDMQPRALGAGVLGLARHHGLHVARAAAALRRDNPFAGTAS